MFGRIIDRPPNRFGIILLSDRSSRTNHNTLAAGNAGNLIQILLKRAADMRIEAAFIWTDDADSLPFGTGGDTAAAQDTFIVVTEHMNRAVILWIFRVYTIIFILIVHFEIFTEFLQLTVAAAYAGEAFSVMGGKDQFQRNLSGSEYFLGVGEDFHAFRQRIYTSGNQAFRAFDFHNADTAGADSVDVFKVTQGGTMNTGRSCGFENRRVLRAGQGAYRLI
jgi:hypothetical protein